MSDSERGHAHEVSAHEVIKMDGGLIGYRWSCSCGRGTDGRHRTAEEAIERGNDHVQGGKP